MMLVRLLIFARCFLDFLLHITALKHPCEVFQEYGDYVEYGGECFIHVTITATWYEAQESCEALGGQLARLEQSDQYDFVMMFNNYYNKGKKLSRRDISIFAWIDGQQINGKLYWTNGQPMTFSKPFIWDLVKPEKTGTFCILGSADNFEKIDCNKQASYLCQHDKQSLPLKVELSPTTSVMARFTTELTSSTTALMTSTGDMTTFLESKMTSLPPRAMAYSKAKLTWNEMNFRNILHTNGVLNPKLKLDSDKIIYKQTLIQCAVKCLSDDCELFNFEGKSGQCHLYPDTAMALKEGAEPVPGWRLYKHGSVITI